MTLTLTTVKGKKISICVSLSNQGRIEPPKAARGHAAYIDGKMLSVTKYSF